MAVLASSTLFATVSTNRPPWNKKENFPRASHPVDLCLQKTFSNKEFDTLAYFPQRSFQINVDAINNNFLLIKNTFREKFQPKRSSSPGKLFVFHKLSHTPNCVHNYLPTSQHIYSHKNCSCCSRFAKRMFKN